MFWGLSAIAALCAVNIYSFYRQYQRNRQWCQQLAEKTMAYEGLKLSQANLHHELAEIRQQLSITKEDPVTHLISWQIFEDRVAQSLRESMRYHFTLGVMYVDINNFDIINDALHREVTDELLREMSLRLQTCIRQVDSMTRLTNGTFVILLNQLNKPETAAIVAQRILKQIEEPFFIKEHELYATVAMGIAIYPTEGQDPNELLHHAEIALRAAQQAEKNDYQFYQAELQQNSQRELIILAGLHKEDFSNDVRLSFQPIMNIDKQSLFCLDVLPSWYSPSLPDEIKIDELYEYADKQHKLAVLIEWLLEQACRQYLQWRKSHSLKGRLGIPVPVKLLENTAFIYRLSQILNDLQFESDMLLLDIKLQTAPNSFDILEKSFNMLNYIGVQLAIDHFGAISVPLTQLKCYPAHFLKLDPSLLQDIELDDRAGAIIKACEGLATHVGMQMIVTGIENISQLEKLRQFVECPLVQGDFISGPIPQAEVMDKLSALVG